MALKPHRHEFQTDITFHCNDVTERGVILVFDSSGSGDSMDDVNSVVALPSGAAENLVPAGLLLNDMVDVDLTRYFLNPNKDEMQIGGKCTLLKKGWVVTNKITGTPVAGDFAYLGANGTVTPTAGANIALVGQFLSAKDSQGYAKVEINLPNGG